MGRSGDEYSSLSRLTPDLAAEVRRNLWVWLAIMVAVAGGMSVLFAIAVDPELSPVTGGVAVVMFGVFLSFLFPTGGLLLTLVYLFDCWPATLRGRFLQEQMGVTPEELSNRSRMQELRSSGFWLAFARGAIVGWGFVSACLLGSWALTGRGSFFGPAGILVLLGGQISAQAWFIRQVVDRSAARSGRPGGCEIEHQAPLPTVSAPTTLSLPRESH